MLWQGHRVANVITAFKEVGIYVGSLSASSALNNTAVGGYATGHCLLSAGTATP